MPVYTFPLQTALDLRAHEEDAAQRRLARAERLVADRRMDLQRSQVRHDAILSTLRCGSGMGAVVMIGEVEHNALVLSELRRRMTQQRWRLLEAEHERDLRRTELLEASRARRTLERLSERREEEHRREETRRELKELDEVAVTRHRVGAGLLSELDNVA